MNGSCGMRSLISGLSHFGLSSRCSHFAAPDRSPDPRDGRGGRGGRALARIGSGAAGRWRRAMRTGGTVDITQLILDDHHEQRRWFAILEQIDAADTTTLAEIWARLSAF